MSGYKVQSVALIVVFCLMPVSSVFSAETWHLGKDDGWKTLSDSNDGKYVQAVAQIKQLINDGKVGKAKKAVAELKKDFPQLAKADFDAFMKAEMLYAAGKFSAAVKSYDEFLDAYPQSQFCDAALDRDFSIAMAYLSGQKITVLGIFRISGFDTGEKIMDKISDRAGDAPIAKKALLAVVEKLEKKGSFDEAYDKWSQISSRWPTGKIGEDAILGMARCKHAIYKGPKYNATSLVSAKTYYENFKQRYPSEANSLGVDAKISQINEQLAYKQLNIAQYYKRTGSIESAGLYYNMVIAGWPESTAARIAKEQMEQKSNIAK